MDSERKNLWYVLGGIFVLFLCIYYWELAEGLLLKILGAATPIIAGCVLAYMVNILMQFYERHYFTKIASKVWVKKSKRAVCMTAALLTLCGIIALVIWLVIPELVACVKLLIAEIPPIMEKLLSNEKMTKVLPETVLKTLNGIDWKEHTTKIISMLTSGIGGAAETILSAVTSVVSSTATVLISIIFSVYLLFSKEKMQNLCKRLMKNYMPDEFNQKSQYVLSVLNESFHGYIVGQCTEAVILGVLCIIGMYIFNFPYAMMIGTLIGFTALIPIAGAYIGAGIGAIMILTISPVKALLFILFIIILQQIEGNLIYPKVVGKKLGLPAVFVLGAITLGGSLMGISGMLIGVPITSAIYRLLGEDMEKRELKN